MPSTTGELVKAKTILMAEVEAAVAAYLADPKAGEIPLGAGYTLDVGDAVSHSFYANPIVSDPATPEAKRRNAVQTAVLLAIPKPKA